jgi:uncharacterized protein YkwD
VAGGAFASLAAEGETTMHALLLTVALLGQTRFEARVLDAVNAERAADGVAPLKYDASLSAASEYWCKVLANERILAHGLPVDYFAPDMLLDVDGDGWCLYTDRAWFFGWTGSVSENGAALKSIQPDQLVWAWMNSPGHRSNLLNPNWTHAGVAKGNFGAGRQSAYMTFGGP